MTDLAAKLERDLAEAERKAWKALAGYKFQMFGYWAAIWVHLNRVGDFKRASPFKGLVHNAREHRATTEARELIQAIEQRIEAGQ